MSQTEKGQPAAPSPRPQGFGMGTKELTSIVEMLDRESKM